MAVELLSPVELDFLWESLGAGELPYPLEVRSHGSTMDERAALRAQVLSGLAGRGLADRSGRPQPHLEDWFEVLARSEVSLDSVHISAPDSPPLLAVAAALGGQGLLAVQDTKGLHLQAVPADGLASAIVGLLPAAPRGTEKSLTVPLEQLLSGSGVDFMQRRSNGERETKGSPGSRPNGDRSGADDDRKALARLHAQPRLRGGQIGANARNRTGGRSRTPVLSWFDTEGHDRRDWITIAPADAPTLRHRLGEMLSRAVNSDAAAY